MKRIVLLSLLMIVVVTVSGKPAYRGGLKRTQPDGTTITVYGHGDECFHWLTDAQGNWLERNEQGAYVRVPAMTETEIQTQRKLSPLYRMPAQQGVPTNLAPRGLVIMVNFTDVKFDATNSPSVMNEMHNGDNYSIAYSYVDEEDGKTYHIEASGSARKYFIDQSGGKYQPTFDVVGPYTLSHEMAWYGENSGRPGTDKRPAQMTKEACELANKNGVNFAEYDNNKDGKVDFVYIIYAGYGEADGGAPESIWPHTWKLSYGGINLYLNDKRVDLYACGSELNYVSKQRAGISTFCHEFSHVLGLPDIYPTNNGSWKTSGKWDIMDYGPYNNDGNTPPAYSGYERMFFGWATPRIIKGECELTINELQEYNDVCVVTDKGEFNCVANNPDPSTFYVLENRQQKGWDIDIPGHGLIITRIAYDYVKWTGNTVNNDGNELGIDLIEADNQVKDAQGYMCYDGKPGDAFPTGATEYLNLPGGYGVKYIKEENEVISMTVMRRTTIDEVKAVDREGTTCKTLENGQVVILRNGEKYSMMGNKME